MASSLQWQSLIPMHVCVVWLAVDFADLAMALQSPLVPAVYHIWCMPVWAIGEDTFCTACRQQESYLKGLH